MSPGFLLLWGIFCAFHFSNIFSSVSSRRSPDNKVGTSVFVRIVDIVFACALQILEKLDPEIDSTGVHLVPPALDPLIGYRAAENMSALAIEVTHKGRHHCVL